MFEVSIRFLAQTTGYNHEIVYMYLELVENDKFLFSIGSFSQTAIVIVVC